MYERVYRVASDPHGVVDILFRAYVLMKQSRDEDMAASGNPNGNTPGGNTPNGNPKNAKALDRSWREKVSHLGRVAQGVNAVPAAFRGGVMATGEARSDSGRGLTVSHAYVGTGEERSLGLLLRFQGLGDVALVRNSGNTGNGSVIPKRQPPTPMYYRLVLDESGEPDGLYPAEPLNGVYPTYEIALSYAGRNPMRERPGRDVGARSLSFQDFARLRGEGLTTEKKLSGDALARMKSRSPNLAFIIKREGYAGSTTLKRAAALDYIQRNPDLTTKEIRALGFRTALDMELVADSHDALKSYLEAGHKDAKDPRPVLSQKQMKRRAQREFSMPDSLEGHDDTAGVRPVANQAFDAQIYRAMHEREDRAFFA